jgi:hypothetical protein
MRIPDVRITGGADDAIPQKAPGNRCFLVNTRVCGRGAGDGVRAGATFRR